MLKKQKRTIKKTIPKKTKPAKRTKQVKTAKSTLVWKRSKRGRPKGKPQQLTHPRGQEPMHKRDQAPARSPSLRGRLGPRGEAGGLTHQNKGETAAVESKFQLGPKQNAGEFQAHNLPFEYGHNRIVLLVIDPKFAFVYWEVNIDKMREALSHVGGDGKLTLRFRNLRDNHSWDVSIYERVGNWYLRLERPEHHLIVEIGMKNSRGDFYTIATSNTMRLPRATLTGPGPIKWLLVSPSGEKILTEVEEYTDADIELLKKILGPYFFDLFKRGRFATITGSSAENVFMTLEDI